MNDYPSHEQRLALVEMLALLGLLTADDVRKVMGEHQGLRLVASGGELVDRPAKRRKP